MTMTRRLALAGALVLGSSGFTLADNEEAAVNQAIENLRKAMLEADKDKLAALVSDQLSYGHSSGVLESKAQYIDVIASKKTIYKSINLLEPSVTVAGPNAIARHIFTAETESGGKPGTARVGALQVWQKQADGWKLLARQAFRLPS
ncbi:MAG: nuclear transport factor 2 family protein [Xanthobacteraceae bacterium]